MSRRFKFLGHKAAVKESAKNWGSGERTREEGDPLAAGRIGVAGGSRAATEEEEREGAHSQSDPLQLGVG
jgi:hypothetical protein